jgi:photosystem II stability/assembly factor-like uncharacterized protein
MRYVRWTRLALVVLASCGKRPSAPDASPAPAPAPAAQPSLPGGHARLSPLSPEEQALLAQAQAAIDKRADAERTFAALKDDKLTFVTPPSDADLVAGAAAGNEVYLAAVDGAIWHSSDGGATWSAVDHHGAGTFTTVWASGSEACAASAKSIVCSRDAGKTWVVTPLTLKESPKAMAVAGDIRLLADFSSFRRSSDAGKTWRELATSRPEALWTDGQHEIAVGQTLSYSGDGGATWKDETFRGDNTFESLAVTAAGDVYAGGYGGTIVHRNHKGGWAVEAGYWLDHKPPLYPPHEEDPSIPKEYQDAGHVTAFCAGDPLVALLGEGALLIRDHESWAPAKPSLSGRAVIGCWRSGDGTLHFFGAQRMARCQRTVREALAADDATMLGTALESCPNDDRNVITAGLTDAIGVARLRTGDAAGARAMLRSGKSAAELTELGVADAAAGHAELAQLEWAMALRAGDAPTAKARLAAAKSCPSTVEPGPLPVEYTWLLAWRELGPTYIESDDGARAALCKQSTNGCDGKVWLLRAAGLQESVKEDVILVVDREDSPHVIKLGARGGRHWEATANKAGELDHLRFDAEDADEGHRLTDVFIDAATVKTVWITRVSVPRWTALADDLIAVVAQPGSVTLEGAGCHQTAPWSAPAPAPPPPLPAGHVRAPAPIPEEDVIVDAIRARGTGFALANVSGMRRPITVPTTADLHAIGGVKDDYTIVGASGTILHGGRDGVTSQVSGTVEDLDGVWSAAGVTCAAGAKGTVVCSVDGGKSWTASASGTRADLHGIAGSGAEVFAVGDHGTIIVSADAGKTWRAAASGVTADLRAVWTDGQQTLAVGQRGTVLRSADIGATWAAEDAGTTADLWAIAKVHPGLVAVGAGEVVRGRGDDGKWSADVPGDVYAGGGDAERGYRAVCGGENDLNYFGDHNTELEVRASEPNWSDPKVETWSPDEPVRGCWASPSGLLIVGDQRRARGLAWVRAGLAARDATLALDGFKLIGTNPGVALGFVLAGQPKEAWGALNQWTQREPGPPTLEGARAAVQGLADEALGRKDDALEDWQVAVLVGVSPTARAKLAAATRCPATVDATPNPGEPAKAWLAAWTELAEYSGPPADGEDATPPQTDDEAKAALCRRSINDCATNPWLLAWVDPKRTKIRAAAMVFHHDDENKASVIKLGQTAGDRRLTGVDLKPNEPAGFTHFIVRSKRTEPAPAPVRGSNEIERELTGDYYADTPNYRVVLSLQRPIGAIQVTAERGVVRLDGCGCKLAFPLAAAPIDGGAR